MKKAARQQQQQYTSNSNVENTPTFSKLSKHQLSLIRGPRGAFKVLFINGGAATQSMVIVVPIDDSTPWLWLWPTPGLPKDGHQVEKCDCAGVWTSSGSWQ